MITGHLALAYAARALRKDASLFVLFAAAIAPDILDLGYFAARFCSPAGLYSHSVPALAILAPVTALAAWAVTRRSDVALAAAALVLLHTPLDLITGYKYLWPGTPVVGLVLYEYPLADFLLEAPLVIAAWWFLRRSGAGPRWATAGFALAALIAVQAAFDTAKLFGEKGKPSGCVATTETGRADSPWRKSYHLRAGA
ncbi:MAG: hypothetical protein U9Q74_02310 [Gemmatimonadota bacterium]|nr:hypothetical protein [Gemmatimonadota bacterium]